MHITCLLLCLVTGARYHVLNYNVRCLLVLLYIVIAHYAVAVMTLTFRSV